MQQLGLTDGERAQLDAKVGRLAEMGFERGAASEALLVHGLNEEAALNSLLGAPTVASGTVLPQPQAPPPQQQQQQPSGSGGSGLFGRWGRG